MGPSLTRPDASYITRGHVVCLEEKFRCSNKKTRAIEHFEEAVRLKPDFVEARYLICASYMAMGVAHTAVIMCERAIRYDPRHVEARYLLGLANIQLGQYEKAYSQVVVLYSLDPAKARLLESDLERVETDLKRARLGACLSNVRSAYEASWRSTCWKLGNPDNNCTLPTLVAEELNKGLRYQVDDCLQRFPQR